jgi:RNA polymerase primary sigma factor
MRAVPERDQRDVRVARREAPTSSDLGPYLEAAAREPLLTKQDEVDLAKTIERGREAEEKLRAGRLRSQRSIRRAREAIRQAGRARHRFIVANLRLVVSVSRKYQGMGLSLLDLIQEGNIGLMRALELFEWRRGFKFSTYATWWIRQVITRGIANQGRTIRLPVHISERIRQARAAAAHLAQRTGHEPSSEELARGLNTSAEEVEVLLEMERRGHPISLHRPVGEEEDTELGELIEHPESTAAYAEVEDEMVRERIAQTLDSLLTDEGRRVLQLRYGLTTGRTLSNGETAKALGLSTERVRVIEREALSTLRGSDAMAAAVGH